MNMTKWIICCFLCCFGLLPARAQQANYALAEKMKTNRLEHDYNRLMPEFVPGGDNFWFRLRIGDGEMYYFADVKAGTVEELFDRERLAAEMGEVTGRSYDPRKLGFWMTPFKEDGVTLYWRDGEYNFEYNVATKKLAVVEPPAGEGNPQAHGGYRPAPPGISPDGKWQVFGIGHDVYIRDLRDSTQTRLTFDGEEDFSYTGARDDSREVSMVVTWASDSERFYHYRHDNRAVEEVAVMNYLRGRPSAGQSQVILAGDKGVSHTEISLFDVALKKQVKVDIGRWKDQMCRVLHTSPDLRQFYMERKNRPCDMLDICRVDVNTGRVETLIHEEGKPYIGLELSSVHFLRNGDIVMWSERTGHGHLYLYDANGKLKNRITAGEWDAGHVVKIDEKAREIFFNAYGFTPGENPSYAKVCRANLDGKGKIILLTPEEATHSVQFSPGGRYLVDTWSRPDTAPQFTVRDMQGRLVMKLGETDITPLYANGWKMPETFSVMAADGETELYGVMWKPFDFDPEKKYPVISCVYPGPQTDNVPLTFEFNTANELLAQVGFVVVAFNHRGGVPYRGRTYRTFGYGNIRDHALADDKCGLEQLIARHPYIDGNRVGVYGHSGGGFMSTAAICTYTDLYKAAVSSAGNHDNNIYSQFFVETHHGIKEIVGEDGESTFELNVVPTNMELAANLKGHLMLVAGGYDGNVHPASTIRMVDAFINHGKDVELVFLPQGRHTYDGASEWYFEHKTWSHFAKYLLGDFTTPCFYDIEFDEQSYRVKKILL